MSKKIKLVMPDSTLQLNDPDTGEAKPCSRIEANALSEASLQVTAQAKQNALQFLILENSRSTRNHLAYPIPVTRIKNKKFYHFSIR